ncbi:hypothetical protein ACIPPJ_14740 [Streptomyces sp. NPDC086091]|uniref:hypothetical protein n=1 Tax=Streptomyces sp. NPDC086091 TaxID=3365751 RepID=UPI0037F7E963
MADRTSKQPPDRSRDLIAGTPFRPRLGDLASDLAKDGRIGVVVALPSDESASYQLRPPGGGADWRARSDGATLRALPVPVTHATPMRRDAVYDHRAQQAALAVTVHFEDGGSCDAMLVLTPAQVELHHAQLERLLDARQSAQERAR